MMKEIYKVRKIKLSLLDPSSHEPYKDIDCEFGRIIEDDGIIYLETHIFENEDFAIFKYDNLSCPASASMLSFDDVKIETPYLSYIRKQGKENKVTFRCFDYITVYEENALYTYRHQINKELQYSQLLRIDFWGLDLIIPSWPVINLMIGDAPFEIQLEKDDETNEMYANIPAGQEFVHNTLTEDIFQIFRNSLIGYLSLINGARVQIIQECYYGYHKLFSYNKIENISCSYYACGNAKVFYPSPNLFEFDNYVRWNQILDLNKFIFHLCSSQQELSYEDGAFILILVFEGLCKRYISIHKKEKKIPTRISPDTFENIKEQYINILERYNGIPIDNKESFKNAINKLNDVSTATSKFYLILDELNIQQTKEIKCLIKVVRNTLVHDAVLKDYYDYVLLSELIREIILRLISSTVERHSEYKGQAIIGDAPNLSYNEYVAKNELDVDNNVIFSQYDNRIKFRITKGGNELNSRQEKGGIQEVM